MKGNARRAGRVPRPSGSTVHPSRASHTGRPLRGWVFGWSVFLVIASVWSFGLVEYLAFGFLRLPEGYRPALALASLPLFGAAFAGFSYRLYAKAWIRVRESLADYAEHAQRAEPAMPADHAVSGTQAERAVSVDLPARDAPSNRDGRGNLHDGTDGGTAALLSLRRLLAKVAAAMTGLSTLAFALVEFGSYRLLRIDSGYEPILMLGMIPPVSILVFFQARRVFPPLDRIWKDFPAPDGDSASRLKKKSGAAILRTQLFRMSALIIVSSVCVYGLVEFIAYKIIGIDDAYNPVLSVGMIFPMGLIVGTLSLRFARGINRRVGELLSAIDRVASGEFGVRLEPGDAGAFADVFAQFNRMGDELAKVQTLRDDFVNGFSHEFKTPIASINGFAKLLLAGSADKASERQYLELIAAESARLAELSDATLLLARLESTQIVPDLETFSLDEQLRQCAILLSPQWDAKGIGMEVELKPVRWTGPPDLARQMWINLIGNAVKFTPAGGTVAISLEREDGFAVVRVRDSGRGIPADEVPLVFDKYYQGKSGQPKKGLGLGLSIVKRIVDLCGGEISVESAVGEGSVFTVILPN